ncbi:MAG: hypothetical protein INR65_19285, partial [Gluconacetobacter diazotrophicus]|nr:hypothetical protein [Gluconacetobacter diazotrophicus]
MQRLAVFPAETLFAAPGTPDQALAGVLVLHGLGGNVARQVRALRAQEDHLRDLDAEQRSERDQLERAWGEQARQQQDLATGSAAARRSQQEQADRAGQAAAAAAGAASAADALGAAIRQI